MNALQQHLANRDHLNAARRARWLEVAAKIHPRLWRRLDRGVWTGPFRHMREMAPGDRFEARSDGSWVLCKGKAVFAEAVPLSHLPRRDFQAVRIVATGPTAKESCWQRARSGEQALVAVNGAPTFLQSLGLSPDLLVITDPAFARVGIRHLVAAPGVPLITTCRSASQIAKFAPHELKNRPFSIVERVNAWYGVPEISSGELSRLNEESGMPFTLPRTGSLRWKAGWSSEPQLGFFSGCTVAFAALQFVVKLGARDIEITGLDLSGQGRVYAEGSDAPASQLQAQYSEFILPSFELMHDALRGSGIRLRNLSPVCPLPAALFETAAPE